MDDEIGKGIVVDMLKYIGENPNRAGLKDTPKRIVKMWKEVFRGYDKTQEPVMTIFQNGHDGIMYDEMICDTGRFYSHCEHHGVPFFGKYYFAYIPDKKVVGISKVARVVDYFSAKLQIQERLTTEIVDYIEKDVEPKGIALIMEASHLCKEMRGVKKKGIMRTAVMNGVFRKDSSCRTEFLNFINGAKNE